MGDLFTALGKGDQALEAFSNSLNIRTRLAEAEPQRADYQRDLSVSFNRIGKHHKSLGQHDAARDALHQDLRITRGLAESSPERADFQVDLAISLIDMAKVETPADQSYLREAFAILEVLKTEGRLQQETYLSLFEALADQLGEPEDIP